MFYLKKISTTALMVTTLMGSGIHFAYARDNGEEEPKQIKVAFSGMRVTSAGEGLSLSLSVEEELGSGSFRRIESSDEAEELIRNLTIAYDALPESAKIVTFPTLKINKRKEGQIAVKEEQEQKSYYRYLSYEKVNEMLERMLAICTETYKQEERRAEEESQHFVRDAEQGRQALERAEQECLDAAEALKTQQDIANARALLLKQQEETAAVLKQQQDALAALQAQLAAQAEIARQQKEGIVAQQAQFAVQQEEFAKHRQEEAAAHQQLQNLCGGRTPDRVARNVSRESERAVQGIQNILSGKRWDHGRKKKE